MATRQYIGARYVPKFYENPDGTNEWKQGVSYEALTIVLSGGSSYTSKKPVPATAGRPEDESEYWALTGNYNGQVEQYRQDVEDAIDKIEGDLSNSLDVIRNQPTDSMIDSVIHSQVRNDAISSDILYAQGSCGFRKNGIDYIANGFTRSGSTGGGGITLYNATSGSLVAKISDDSLGHCNGMTHYGNYIYAACAGGSNGRAYVRVYTDSALEYVREYNVNAYGILHDGTHFWCIVSSNFVEYNDDFSPTGRTIALTSTNDPNSVAQSIFFWDGYYCFIRNNLTATSYYGLYNVVERYTLDGYQHTLYTYMLGELESCFVIDSQLYGTYSRSGHAINEKMGLISKNFHGYALGKAYADNASFVANQIAFYVDADATNFLVNITNQNNPVCTLYYVEELLRLGSITRNVRVYIAGKNPNFNCKRLTNRRLVLSGWKGGSVAGLYFECTPYVYVDGGLIISSRSDAANSYVYATNSSVVELYNASISDDGSRADINDIIHAEGNAIIYVGGAVKFDRVADGVKYFLNGGSRGAVVVTGDVVNVPSGELYIRGNVSFSSTVNGAALNGFLERRDSSGHPTTQLRISVKGENVNPLRVGAGPYDSVHFVSGSTYSSNNTPFGNSTSYSFINFAFSQPNSGSFSGVYIKHGSDLWYVENAGNNTARWNCLSSHSGKFNLVAGMGGDLNWEISDGKTLLINGYIKPTVNFDTLQTVGTLPDSIYARPNTATFYLPAMATGGAHTTLELISGVLTNIGALQADTIYYVNGVATITPLTLPF